MNGRREKLAALRKAAGHTQESLARELQVQPSTVRRWERGVTVPRPWRRADLAAALLVSVDELNRVLSDDRWVGRGEQGVRGAPTAVGFRVRASWVEDTAVEDSKGALNMAEERARKFSQAFGSSELSDETLEQAYDDVARLTVDYPRRPITDIVGHVIGTQEAVFSLLEQRQRPAHARQLFFLAGVVSGVLAKACHDFMNPHGAMVHARTAFLCADQADHDGLRAWTRGLESQISYWAGRPHEALRYAQAGAAFAAKTRSSMAVWLPASEARAWAVLGNASEAVAAIQRAETGLDVLGPDELDELGGLCTFRPARQLYYAADALVWLSSEAQRAEDYATRAVQAYDDTTAPEWSFGDQAGSQANLAIARVVRGEEDGAAEALKPVLSLAPELRINGIVRSTQRVHDALRRSTVAQSTTALQQEIEEFTRTPLPALPPSRG